MSKYIFCPQFDTFLPEAKEEAQTREIDHLIKKKKALTNVANKKIISYIEKLVGQYNHISFNGATEEYKFSDNTFNIFISQIEAIFDVYEGPEPTNHTYANKKKFFAVVKNWAARKIGLMNVEGKFIDGISASILKEYIPTCVNQITGASPTQLQYFNDRICKYYTVEFLKTTVTYRRTNGKPVCRPKTLKDHEFKAFDFGKFKKKFENRYQNTNQKDISKKYAKELTEHYEQLWKKSEEKKEKNNTLPIQQPEIYYSDRRIQPIDGADAIRMNYGGQHGVENYSYEHRWTPYNNYSCIGSNYSYANYNSNNNNNNYGMPLNGNNYSVYNDNMYGDDWMEELDIYDAPLEAEIINSNMSVHAVNVANYLQ